MNVRTNPPYFWALLLLGLALRMVCLNSPLLDAMSSRQTQTSGATKSQIEEPGWQWDSEANWRGDQHLRVVQEIPLHNAISQGVYHTLHLALPKQEVNSSRLSIEEVRLLDLSGKLVSILFWALAFLCLQHIWARLLTSSEAFWANLLFVVSPLGIFFGQAVMPESLLMFLSMGFVWATLAYAESPKTERFVMVACIGALGLLLKAPGFSHLGFFAILVLWKQRGFRFLLATPVHWLGLGLIAFVMRSWAGYVDHTNLLFGDWTASGSLADFLGKISDRLAPQFYIKVTGYISVLLLTPVGFLGVLAGLFLALRRRRESKVLVGLFWCASLVAFYLLWGPRTAGGHSYYNLPALGPSCFLFGLAAAKFWPSPFASAMIGGRSVAISLLLILLGWSAVGTWYLFRGDEDHWKALLWLEQTVPPDDGIITANLSSPEAVHYPHNSDVPYYTGRTTWNWTRYLTPSEREQALAKSRWLVVFEEAPPSRLEQWRRKYKQMNVAPPALMDREHMLELFPIEVPSPADIKGLSVRKKADPVQ